MKGVRFRLLLLFACGFLGAAVLNSNNGLRFNDIRQPLVKRNPGDTIFIDDLEGDVSAWSFQDISLQDTFWHLDTIDVLEGMYSMWCGTYSEPGWTNPDWGYGDEWAQFLISPYIDLTAVTGDSVWLIFYHYYCLEAPSPYLHWDGWDAVNLWVSIDSGATWEILYPDTIMCPGTSYNMTASYAWYWNSQAGMYDSIPGWGESNYGWMEQWMDLTQYMGNVIQIRFCGFSDPLESDQSGGPYYGMWYIDPLYVWDNYFNEYFYEDWESGMGDWVAQCREPGGIWWHLTESDAYSPTHSFWNGDSTTGEMPGAVFSAVVTPEIDLSFVSMNDSCIFDFYVSFDFQNPDDGYQIEVTSDGGATWTNIYYPTAGANYYFTGSSDSVWDSHNELWSQSAGIMLLDPWVGEIIQIRVSAFSHITNTIGYGLYLDDFVVTGEYMSFPTPKHVMVFDDDIGAEDVWGFGWEKYYESAVSNLGYSYVGITDTTPGLPDSLYMRQNGMVIWNLGPKGYRYTSDDPIIARAEENLKGYLRLGGKLLLVGQDYLFGNFPNTFADSVLSITSCTEDVGCDQITGATGDPIGDGLSYPLDFAHLDGNGYGYDYVDDFTTTTAVSFYTNTTGQPIMLRKQYDTYKLVFSAFPIEALEYSFMRDTVMNRIINWLDPCPPTPELTMAVSEEWGVRLYWLRNPPRDLMLYNIYRATNPNGPFINVCTQPPTDTTCVDPTAMLDSTYYYGIVAMDSSAQVSSMSELIRITYAYGLAENRSATINKPFLQLAPNPFSNKLTIEYAVCSKQYGAIDREPTLRIYDATGRLVKDFSPFTAYGLPAAVLYWDGTDDMGRTIPAGIYFIQLQTSDHQITKKAILLR